MSSKVLKIYKLWNAFVCYFNRKLFRLTWPPPPSCQLGRSWCSPSWVEVLLVYMVGHIQTSTFWKSHLLNVVYPLEVYYFFLFILKHTHAETIPCGSLPVQSLGPQQSDSGMTKKRRKRRRKARPEAGGGRREESGEEFSEDEDMFTIDLSSDEEREAEGSRCVCVCICCHPAFIAVALLCVKGPTSGGVGDFALVFNMTPSTRGIAPPQTSAV